MSDTNIYQEAFHLGVNALVLCFGNQFTATWLPQIRTNIETAAAKLSISVDVEAISNINGDIATFEPYRLSIINHLCSSSERSANCFELGVKMIGIVFSRDFALQNGELESLYVAALKKDAKAADVDWAIFEDFVASLKNPQVDGEEVVDIVFPKAADAVVRALATQNSITNRPAASEHPHTITSNEIRSMIARLVAFLGAILLIGGVVVAIVGSSSDTTFKLFGQECSSTSVGVALAFIGTVMVALTFRRVLASLDKSQEH